MNTHPFLKQFSRAAILSCALAASAHAAITDLAIAPMETDSGTVTTKPNVMFMLDDSGSMDWDYMPDNAKNFAGKYGFNSNHCNGVYYDPNTEYLAPVKSDGTRYPDATFSAAWKDGYQTGLGTVDLNSAFKGGSGSGSSGYTSYTGPAFYYTYTGAQTTEAQMNILNTSSTYYQECNSSIGSTPGSAVFTKTRLASVPTTTITVSGGGGAAGATITVSGSSSSTVSGITVNGVQILNATTSSSKRSSSVASAIASGINACTSAVTGNCTTAGGTGYSATVSGSVVTITGTSGSGYTPVITKSGSMTFTATAFPTVTATTVSSITVNGTQLLSSSATGSSTTALASDIRSKITATGYSATVSGSVVTVTGPASASTYTPVITVASGSMTLATDAFPESTAAKLQNFANWYSYYSNRMLTMKTGVGQAFSAVSSDYRVGYMTMNNNVSPDIVEIADFAGGCAVGSGTCQKDKWYTKLYAANPGSSTPLREALSHVGQLYAHKFGNVTTYKSTITVGGSGSTVVDSITVNGTEIMNDASVASTSTSTVASNIADQINAMLVTDYGATASGNVVTIYGPAGAATPTAYTPVVTDNGGGMTFTRTAFTAVTTTATLNGILPADPVQYSCQQNFVILSTDGYWNGSTSYKLDNTAVGQQDDVEPRPMNDGSSMIQRTTTQLTQTTTQPQQLQSRTSQLQSRTAQLQRQTSTLQGTLSKVLMRCNNTSATCGTAPATGVANANWSVVTSGSCTISTNVQCAVVSGLSSVVNVASSCNTAGSITTNTSYPSVAVTITNSSSVVIDRVRADGTSSTDILSAETSSSSTNSTVASRIAANINACTSSTSGTNCDLTGHTATVGTGASNNVVTITGPNVTSALLVRVKSGGGSATITYSYTAGSTTGYTLNNADSNGNVYSACAYTAWSAAASASSCTAAAQSGSSPYTVLTAVQCPSTSIVSWADASTCTTTAPDGSGNYTDCQYATPGTTTAGWSSWANASSCTAVQDTTSPYDMTATSGLATDCQSVVASCTPGVGGCSSIVTGPIGVASCTAGTSGGVTTTCETVTIGPTGVSSCTAAAASSSNSYTTTTCVPAVTGPSNTLADVAEYYYVNDLRSASLGNCTGALGTSVCANNVLTSDLDTATHQHMTTFTLGLGARGRMVYSSDYMNLATSCDPATDGDYCSVLRATEANGTNCPWQTVTTPHGYCTWPTPSSGAIENIDDLWHAAVNGRGNFFSARDPNTLATSLSSTLDNIGARVGAAAAAATSNPNVSSGDNFVFSSSYTSVDWTGELVRQEINLTTGAVSATTDWAAQALLDTLAATTANGGSRNIYTYNPTAATHTGDSAALSAAKLKSFTYANLTAAEQAYFDAAHIAGLSQFCASGAICLSSANQALAAGSNLVNYLRGERSNEGGLTEIAKYYRSRPHILGDIVNAEVAYVKQALYSYADTNYADFAANQASRTGMVYAASNDGMLHAFYAGSTITCQDAGGAEVSCDTTGAIRLPCTPCGAEAWAYIPSLVLPDLHKLADKNLSTHHYYLVDGSPVTGDICPNAPSSTCSASEWKTILVGGLNLGGRGYYALDVTDPLNPKALWEFSDPNMGYTYGNPQITKVCDDSTCATKTWVVMVTSGYNNVPNEDGAGGDGVGRLYILNAATGALIRTISTGVGSTGTPSGLARISARVLNPATDNSALEVYGGDLLGNLWRFDINNNVGPTAPTYTYEAQLLATLKDDSGVAQPITIKPEIGIVSNQEVIFVGTGRFLGTSDLTTTQQQTMYAIKDPQVTDSVPGTAIFDDPRASTCATPSSSGCFVQQTVTNTTCPAGTAETICAAGDEVRTGSRNTVDFSSQNGWYVDFPDSGERDNTDPILALGTLGFVTNTPSSGTGCTVLGYSFRWFLDYRTGAPVTTSTTDVLATKLDDTFATRPVYVRLPNNAIVELTRTAAGETVTSNVPIGNAGGSTRRTSWRELPQE